MNTIDRNPSLLSTVSCLRYCYTKHSKYYLCFWSIWQFRENSSSRLLVQWTDFDLGIFSTHRLGSGMDDFPFPNTTCRASQTEPKSGRLLFFLLPSSATFLPFSSSTPPFPVGWLDPSLLQLHYKGKFYPWYACHLAREFIHLNVNNCNMMKHYHMVFLRKLLVIN